MGAGDHYYISKEEQKQLQDKAARRAVLREEFQRLVSDPRRHGHGGAVFDPAFQRLTAMKVNMYEFFRPNASNAVKGALLLAPMIIIGYLMKTDRDQKEHKYRTGQVAYKDRPFKFI